MSLNPIWSVSTPRDYDKANAYFTDDIVLKFAGYRFSGKKNFHDFYRFFHYYIREQVIERSFAADEENVIIKADVQPEGRRHLSRGILDEKGFGRLPVPGLGERVEIAQFIHYRIENGKFADIRCVIKEN